MDSPEHISRVVVRRSEDLEERWVREGEVIHLGEHGRLESIERYTRDRPDALPASGPTPLHPVDLVASPDLVREAHTIGEAIRALARVYLDLVPDGYGWPTHDPARRGVEAMTWARETLMLMTEDDDGR